MEKENQRPEKVPVEIAHFLKKTEELLEVLDEVESTNQSDSALDFCDSVRTKVLSMMDWVKKNNRVSEKMEQSVSNMISGANKWIRDN